LVHKLFIFGTTSSTIDILVFYMDNKSFKEDFFSAAGNTQAENSKHEQIMRAEYSKNVGISGS